MTDIVQMHQRQVIVDSYCDNFEVVIVNYELLHICQFVLINECLNKIKNPDYRFFVMILENTHSEQKKCSPDFFHH